MGYIKHNAIIVTSWDDKKIEQARSRADEIGMSVSEVIISHLNGYGSILIAPDGSKEGWEDSELGDTQRMLFRQWLDKQKYDDGSSSFEWCEVSYGSDDRESKIVKDAWT